MARRSLIVANGTFADPRIPALCSPIADADHLSELLQLESVGGYSVTICKNANLVTSRRQIQTFFDDSEYGDVLLMLISGHGIKDSKGKLHFAVSDTELAALNATSLDAQFVIECLDSGAASKKVLFIDTCYSGAFATSSSNLKSALISVTKDDFGNSGSIGKAVITASTSIQLAREIVIKEKTQSVFTRHLIEGIRTGHADASHTGQISIDNIYRYVCDQLRFEKADQAPQPFYFGIDGSTIIALNPNRRIRNSFTFSDVLDHRIVEDILSLNIPKSGHGHIPDICVFVEDFLASAKVARRYRHSTSWVTSEMLANCFSYAPLSSTDNIDLRIQAARGGIVVSLTQPDDPNFDLEAILANPLKAQSFMQMMNRAGSRWYSRRAAGQLEVGLHLKLNYKRPTPTGSDSERFISFREIDIHSVISINTVYAVLYQENGALVARLVGSILDENHLDFQDCLFGAVDVCRSLSLVALVVDLRDVDYLPSRGLRALSSAMATARLYDIEIVLGRPGPALREVLSISRYDVLFRVVPR